MHTYIAAQEPRGQSASVSQPGHKESAAAVGAEGLFALTSPPRRRAETSAECSLGRWEWAEAATGRRIPSRAAGPPS
jgi:hypothetical protein